MTLSIALVLCYFLLIIGITYYGARHETRDQFMIGGRTMGFFQIFSSMFAGWFSGTMLMGVAAFAYADAGVLFYILAGSVGSFVVLMLLAGPLRRVAAEQGIYTLPDFFSRTFGRPVVVLTAIITFTCYFLFIMMELMIGGTLVASISGYSYETGVIVIALSVAAYLAVGGFSVIVKTDILQFFMVILLVGAFIILGDYSSVPQNSVADLAKQVTSMPLWVWLPIFLFVFPAQIAAPDLWQRIYAAKTERTAQSAVMIFGVLFSVVFLAAMLVAMNVGYLHEGLQDREVVFKAIELFLPMWVQPIVLVCCLAIVMSSLDSFFFVTGQSLLNDGVARFMPYLAERPRLCTRIGIFTVMPVAVFAALHQPDIITLFYFILYLYATLMPTIYGVFMKNPPRGTGIFLAVLGSAVANGTLFYMGLLTEWINLAILAVSMIFPFVYDFVICTVQNRFLYKKA